MHPPPISTYTLTYLIISSCLSAFSSRRSSYQSPLLTPSSEGIHDANFLFTFQPSHCQLYSQKDWKGNNKKQRTNTKHGSLLKNHVSTHTTQSRVEQTFSREGGVGDDLLFFPSSIHFNISDPLEAEIFHQYRIHTQYIARQRKKTPSFLSLINHLPETRGSRTNFTLVIGPLLMISFQYCQTEEED